MKIGNWISYTTTFINIPTENIWCSASPTVNKNYKATLKFCLESSCSFKKHEYVCGLPAVFHNFGANTNGRLAVLIPMSIGVL